MKAYVYFLASKKHGVIYIGVTTDLPRRMYEHRHRLIKGFTKEYNVTILVYFEVWDLVAGAIQRERQLKKWNRAWKVHLIEEANPEWRDLYEEIMA